MTLPAYTSYIPYNVTEECLPWFQGINWDLLSKKKLPAPFVPKICDETDVSNFSEEFTNMEAADSPAVVPLQGDKLFKVGDTVTG